MDDKKPIPTPNGGNASPAVPTTNGEEESGKRVGCAHYKRRAQFVTPCCNKFYMCRYCHDENETHFFNRKTVTELICTECNTRQRVQAECEKCGVRFGRYTCLVCNLFDDEDRNQYHCDGCGICRVGGRGKFFHCEVCNMCLPLQLKFDGHRCVENVSRSNCPVCLDDIHTSRIPCHIPDCGHLLHRTCFEELLSSGHYACPTCQTSMMDMIQLWEYLDAEVSATPMPKEYENYYVDILCKDCHKESTVKFHVVGLKCTNCGAYNTCRTKTKASIDGTNSCSSAVGGMGSGAGPNSTLTTAPPPMVVFPIGHTTESGTTTLRLEGPNGQSSTRYPMANGGPSTSTAPASSSSTCASSITTPSTNSSSSSSSSASSSSTVVSIAGSFGGGHLHAHSNGYMHNHVIGSSSSSSSSSSRHTGGRSSTRGSSSSTTTTNTHSNGHSSVGVTATGNGGDGTEDDRSNSSTSPPICDDDPRSSAYSNGNSNDGAAQI